MRVLDLFSGIGGFSLGLERAGMKTVAFCEIDPFCRRVLAKHWPEVPCYDDIRTLTAERLASDGISVDLICGGFPCQDISLAGPGDGLAGERSGLWREYARLVGELRPKHVIVENVAALLGRGLGDVLGDMASLGYDAEWHCIPASAVGAPHQRDRIWIMANPARVQSGRSKQWPERERVGARGQSEFASVADAISEGLERGADIACHLAEQLSAAQRGGAFSAISYAVGEGCPQQVRSGETLLGTGSGEPSGPECGRRHPWLVEPDVGRVADGVPDRVDRLKGLGNAVVPQIPEMIGRAIMEACR